MRAFGDDLSWQVRSEIGKGIRTLGEGGERHQKKHGLKKIEGGKQQAPKIRWWTEGCNAQGAKRKQIKQAFKGKRHAQKDRSEQGWSPLHQRTETKRDSRAEGRSGVCGGWVSSRWSRARGARVRLAVEGRSCSLGIFAEVFIESTGI